jgi:hypothetical protein
MPKRGEAGPGEGDTHEKRVPRSCLFFLLLSLECKASFPYTITKVPVAQRSERLENTKASHSQLRPRVTNWLIRIRRTGIRFPPGAAFGFSFACVLHVKTQCHARWAADCYLKAFNNSWRYGS